MEGVWVGLWVLFSVDECVLMLGHFAEGEVVSAQIALWDIGAAGCVVVYSCFCEAPRVAYFFGFCGVCVLFSAHRHISARLCVVLLSTFTADLLSCFVPSLSVLWLIFVCSYRVAELLCEVVAVPEWRECVLPYRGGFRVRVR